jgi:coenzyme F420-reducing hydrogenase beta subunit
MYFKTKDLSECCGCSACIHSCPVHAISFVEDQEGFMYPEINEDTCINCGLCERVCPFDNPDYQNEKSPLVFASMLKNKTERQKSSSGGLFYVLAKHIIERGGIVYGATLDENLNVKHIGAESLSELQKLRGSKYVQSDLRNVFIEIRSQLKAERWVYFVGTGCQVAGLKSFLRKDYPTLITSDLVCHGVPSQKLFSTHIKYLEEKYHGQVSDYQFRDNATWGVCEMFHLTNPKGKIKHIRNSSYELSPYLYSFMYAFTYRQSCYNCKFAQIPRQGDITLADYWGCHSFFPKIDSSKGVSLILINTNKGKEIWNRVKDNVEYYPSNVDDGAKYNSNLVQVTNKPDIRNTVYKMIDERGYASVATTDFRSPRYVIYRLRQYLEMMGLWKYIRKIRQL